MINKTDRNSSREKRHRRVRAKISGTTACPRLNVFKSNSEIYAQIIDDTKGITLAAASTLDKDLADALKGKTKTEQARLVGESIAAKAVKANVANVVFDRGGYLYIGRVQALADGARSAGLKF